jgi:hypothetical protein
MHHLSLITYQADELKRQYDKNPTEKNKKKWYNKIKEANIKTNENILRKRRVVN